MFNQFDVVQLLTTKRVRYMSGPKGQAADPHGNWSIVGFVEADAIIAKDSTVVRAPIADLKKIASYNTNTLMAKVSKAGYFTNRKSNHGQKEDEYSS